MFYFLTWLVVTIALLYIVARNADFLEEKWDFDSDGILASLAACVFWPLTLPLVLVFGPMIWVIYLGLKKAEERQKANRDNS